MGSSLALLYAFPRFLLSLPSPPFRQSSFSYPLSPCLSSGACAQDTRRRAAQDEADEIAEMAPDERQRHERARRALERKRAEAEAQRRKEALAAERRRRKDAKSRSFSTSSPTLTSWRREREEKREGARRFRPRS